MADDYRWCRTPRLKKGQRAYQVSWSNAIAMDGPTKSRGRDLRRLQGAAAKAGRRSSTRSSRARRGPTSTGARSPPSPQLAYFTRPQSYTLELTYLDTWLPVLDILSKHMNGMLADAKVDPVKALADADREAQAKVAEIRKK